MGALGQESVVGPWYSSWRRGMRLEGGGVEAALVYTGLVTAKSQQFPPLKPPRVVLSSFPERYSLPARPTASAVVQDSHRQTGFLLGQELATFESAMNLQLGIVAENAKLRGSHAAAMFTLGSRAFSHLADACTLISYGSYASCPALLRTALDFIAVERSLIAGGFADYEEWFAYAVSLDRRNAAILIETGRYKAASALIADERLGALYRLLIDLSMPHFGSTVLLTAPETGLQKIAPSFADGAFHLGWAELITGWLLTLADEQLAAAVQSGVFTLSETLSADCEAIQRDIRSALANKRRCYVEEKNGRFVFHNFRRATSGQPKRIAMG
jgi:hypothetical protein